METNTKDIWVTKSSGDKAPFSRDKLQHSLRKSGAREKDVQRIILEIEKLLYDGISTKKIYKKAFSLLKKTSRPTAAKYKLKKAIMELGPSGFPFEKYLAEVLKHQGYKTKVGEVIKGKCIQHEVDIVASKGNQYLYIECKFHSDSSRICNVKIPLYIHSRFLDLTKGRKQTSSKNGFTYQGWIATNTRFSADAMKYGNCAGLYLLGWNYPSKGSLKERIDRSGVHPITCLTTLTKREKKLLLEKMAVLCKDISNNKKILLSVGVKEGRAEKIMAEAKALCEI